jgi:hypothetical protein
MLEVIEYVRLPRLDGERRGGEAFQAITDVLRWYPNDNVLEEPGRKIFARLVGGDSVPAESLADAKSYLNELVRHYRAQIREVSELIENGHRGLHVLVQAAQEALGDIEAVRPMLELGAEG